MDESISGPGETHDQGAEPSLNAATGGRPDGTGTADRDDGELSGEGDGDAEG